LTVTAANTVTVADPTGTAGWSVATISVETVNAQENVTYYLRGATSTTNAGAISVDYSIGTNGALTAVDLFAYHPDGALTATFYSGAEALDGYAYTQYLLNTSGTLTEVIAVTAAGKAYIGS
jgi:hypothetical protein